MRVEKMSYLRTVNGVKQVKVDVPKALWGLVLGDSGKPVKALTRFTGTGNDREAKEIARPVIDEFKRRIKAAQIARKDPNDPWAAYKDWQATRVRMTVAQVPEHLRHLTEGRRTVFVTLDAPLRHVLGTTRAAITEAPAIYDGKTRVATFRTGGAVLFDDIFPPWEVECKPNPETVRDFKCKLAGFVAHLGHNDAKRVTRADLVNYKAVLLARYPKQRTVHNHLTAIKRIVRYAFDSGLITAYPFDGFKFSPVIDPHTERLDFSPEDRARIYREAHASPDPAVKWLHLLGLFGGGRIEDYAEADSRDVKVIGEIPVLEIGYEYRTGHRRVKNMASVRTLPLHPLIAEGFLAYVKSLPPGPLFPFLKADQDDRLAEDASRRAVKFLRDIGITEPRKVYHSHRHSVVTILCDHGVREDVADVVVGHTGKQYNHYPVSTLYEAVKKIPDPTTIGVIRDVR